MARGARSGLSSISTTAFCSSLPIRRNSRIRSRRFAGSRGEHELLRRQDLSRVVLMGASAGGFLALAAGFLLGSSQVRGIVSISGPTLPHWYSKNADRSAADGLLRSPMNLLLMRPRFSQCTAGTKPSPTENSTELVKKLRSIGRPASVYLFDGPGELHGIWRNTEEPLYLFAHIEDAIAGILARRALTEETGGAPFTRKTMTFL